MGGYPEPHPSSFRPIRSSNLSYKTLSYKLVLVVATSTGVAVMKSLSLVPAALLAYIAPATADSLITNGNFETGIAGWTKSVQFGSDGNIFIVPNTNNGGTSPQNGNPYAFNPNGELFRHHRWARPGLLFADPIFHGRAGDDRCDG